MTADRKLHRTCALLWFITSVSAAQAPRTPVQASAAARFRVESIIEGLAQPVAIAFLPNGRALVADRATASLGLWDPRTRALTQIQNLPPILTGEDAGLLDVLVHPQWQQNEWIYIAYAEGTAERSTLAVDRFRLQSERVTDRKRLFTANAYSEDRYHYGGRLAIQGDFLFVTVGDRHHQRRAQDLQNHAGKIVRVHDDGRVPTDNPFAGRDSVMPEVWSLGHRNPQALTVHPATGALWSHEHGPLGGDELNVVRGGGNYGWPVISYGWEYEGGPVGQGIVTKDSMEQPVWVWTPAIAPSGMLFYTGIAFPGWKGNLLIGAMGKQHINRLVLQEGKVILEERLIVRQWGRVRCVSQGPEGFVYFCSDNGAVLRLRPEP